ncbi:MBL fold metallo-hydrolase [Clostridium botulinum]|uniref:MBL fold metallo-hydrolase n=1 Tax=Clostridium botulinum TaxID=1491 RepID=UPI00174DD337|nr:MBL fold metallo-hydrolase [Clostridium botulinum]MBD5639031.1 MBL fold metallo-hydrolase [Clostridium botulinum]
MKITVLVENNTISSDCEGKHGLSLHIETTHHSILFDFGPDGSTLVKNANVLGIGLSNVDIAFLSHGHMDHGGGLNTFLEGNANSVIYARPDAFSEHIIKAFGKDYPVGLEPSLSNCPQIALTKSSQIIDEELQVFSSPCGNVLKPMFNNTLYAEKNGVIVEDDFSHEQSLLITEGETTVLVGGCAHGGIVNLLNKAEELLGRPVDFVVSGFHLYDPPTKKTEPESRIDELAAKLSKYSTGYFTCHCTGKTAFNRLHFLLGDQISTLSTGDVIEL